MTESEPADNSPVWVGLAGDRIGDPVQSAAAPPSEPEIGPLPVCSVDEVFPGRHSRQAFDALFDDRAWLQVPVTLIFIRPVVDYIAVGVVVARDPEKELRIESGYAHFEESWEPPAEATVKSPEPFLGDRMRPGSEQEDVGTGRAKVQIASLARFRVTRSSGRIGSDPIPASVVARRRVLGTGENVRARFGAKSQAENQVGHRIDRQLGGFRVERDDGGELLALKKRSSDVEALS